MKRGLISVPPPSRKNICGLRVQSLLLMTAVLNAIMKSLLPILLPGLTLEQMVPTRRIRRADFSRMTR